MNARNQKGFAPWLIILILLILLLLGFVGWRVWDSRDDGGGSTPDSSESAGSDEAGDEPEATVTTVMPPSEAYRVALPEGWVKAICPDTEHLLFLAQTTDKLGKCNTESGGTVAITKTGSDAGHPESYYTADPYYGGVSYAPVMIDSMAGYKVAYTVASADGLGYPPVGTHQIQYVLFDGPSSYVLVYTRFAADPDLSAAFQTLAESFDKL